MPYHSRLAVPLLSSYRPLLHRAVIFVVHGLLSCLLTRLLPRLIRDILEARTKCTHLGIYLLYTYISMPATHTHTIYSPVRPDPFSYNRHIEPRFFPAKVVDYHPGRRSARYNCVLSCCLASRLFRTWRDTIHLRMQCSSIHIDSVADFMQQARRPSNESLDTATSRCFFFSCFFFLFSTRFENRYATFAIHGSAVLSHERRNLKFWLD